MKKQGRKNFQRASKTFQLSTVHSVCRLSRERVSLVQDAQRGWKVRITSKTPAKQRIKHQFPDFSAMYPRSWTHSSAFSSPPASTRPAAALWWGLRADGLIRLLKRPLPIGPINCCDSVVTTWRWRTLLFLKLWWKKRSAHYLITKMYMKSFVF